MCLCINRNARPNICQFLNVFILELLNATNIFLNKRLTATRINDTLLGSYEPSSICICTNGNTLLIIHTILLLGLGWGGVGWDGGGGYLHSTSGSSCGAPSENIQSRVQLRFISFFLSSLTISTDRLNLNLSKGILNLCIKQCVVQLMLFIC